MNTPLNTSLIENPGLWDLSLMISGNVIYVDARKVVGDEARLSAAINLDPSIDSQASTVEEAIYANPMLLMPFRKTDIVIDSPFVLAVPNTTDAEDFDLLFTPKEQQVTLTTAVDSRNDILFRMDKSTYNFLQRTFDNVVPVHPLAVLCRYFGGRARIGNSGKMFIDIESDTMNVVVYNHMGLAMCSRYEYSDITTAAYYALAAADTAGFDFSEDEIRIAGNSDRRSAITPLLRRFARHVMPAIFPSAANTAESGDSSILPFTLTILPLCE